MAHSSSSWGYRERSKSEAYAQNTYAQLGDGPEHVPAELMSNNPFRDAARIDKQPVNYSRHQRFDSIAEDAPEVYNIEVNAKGDHQPEQSRQSAYAPELYVAETEQKIDPQLNTDAPLEEDLFRRYIPEAGQTRQLGTGGQVCTSKETGSKVVVKRVLKSDAQAYTGARREVEVMGTVSDPAITALFECLELEHAVWSVTEYRPARPINQIIMSRGPLSDDAARPFLNQLFGGIAGLFMAGFAHLRICPDTVYLDDYSQVVIKDFQYVCEYGKDKVDDLYAATEEKHESDIYVAPEVFASRMYNARKAVMWSCGVLVYFVITGQTKMLSNLDHPSFETSVEELEPESTSSRRKMSVSANAPKIIHYPSRFAAPSYAREIIPKMLVQQPKKRAELIEVASRVPKIFSDHGARPLMELAWLDYKTHVGPYAGLHQPSDQGSSASSIYSVTSRLSRLSRISNPFGSLLNRGSARRQSAPVYSGFV